MAWREGTKGLLSSRFARVPVRVAHRGLQSPIAPAAEWLLIEWPEGESAPTKYWLSTLPADTSMVMLVRWAKVRWRIERDYEELKQEFGLDQFEGRGWRGFHHHATLCIAGTGSWPRKEPAFPPLGLWHSYKSLTFPRASVRGGLLNRPERHVESSIATFRLRYSRNWLAQHPCIWCGRAS